MRFFLKFISAVVLALVLGLLLYLLLPSPAHRFVEIGEYPAEPPVKVDSEQQCQPDRLYIADDSQRDADSEVIDPRCFKLQERLVEAAEDGDLNAIRNAIQQGASVNSPAWSYGELKRPLTEAIWSRQTAAVKLLLDNGGNANDYYYCCMSHKSILTIAVNHNDLETIKLLIARGADLDFVGQFGEGVMQEADRVGTTDTKKLIGAAHDRDLRHRIKSRTDNLLHLLGLKNQETP